MPHAEIMAGCQGYVRDEVMLCGGTSFVVASITTKLENDREFTKYAYEIMRINKGPITEYSAILNFVYFLKSYIRSEKYDSLTEWLRLHRRCGVYMYMQ